MTKAPDLETLTRLEQVATSGPWYIRHLEHDHAMGAVGIATEPDTGENENIATMNSPGPALLAATLIQAPPYVVSADGRWSENAELIVAVRNPLPELLRLARLGQRSDES